MSEYDPLDNASKSYELAISTMREKLASFRKEVIGDCTLYLGDCRELLPLLPLVDHVISDPPYEDELHGSFGSITRNDGQSMIKDLGFVGINASRAELSRLCVERCAGWAVLFCIPEGVRAWRDDLQAAGAKWDTPLAWVKPDASPRFNGQGAARGFENAVTVWCGTGYRKWNGGGRRGVFTHCVNTARQGEHPTEKPVPLMRELVSLYSDAGQTILDPFMGSGTTGVACTMLGRKFIGIEMDPRWFDLSCRRIERAYAQPDMFVEAPQQKAEQLNLLEAGE